MATSYRVKFWDHRHRPGRKSPWMVRWTVATGEFSESYLTKTQADGRKAQLVTAAASHEPFDTETGLPLSELRKLKEDEKAVTWYQHGRNYVEARWDGAPAKTRTTWADALATVTFELVKSKAGMPDKHVLRRALYSWGFNVNRWDEEPPAEVAKALAWVARNSLDVSELEEAKVARRMLAALSVKLDGTKAAASTIRRKRAILGHVIGLAIEDGLLAANPLSAVQWQAPQIEEEVNPEYVMNPEQVTAMLAAIGSQGRRGPRLVAFFACIYYAGMRPGEVVHLRKDRCVLPETGWGRLNLNGNSPRVGSSWTDTGATHDPRALKHRSEKAVRPVPIPPELVRLLREHIEQYGTAPDGRLFRTLRNGMVQESGYGVVWSTARAEVLSVEEQATPLAKRPYDGRHAGISLWLASGVAPAECARRAGHSIAVLLRVYAKCIHGDEDHANRLITERLSRRSVPDGS
ncbi:tyrosine-type recombinase/integrase [Kitasatospora sp. GAS1066B]|uniref:tyrosine-type recombinase/integrase n=2 Tax=Kitasatospora TaxID=2063 RepID=UPI00247BEB00|nr:integrase [Kitasatospora sp. MAP12-44]